ncbi:MAG: leucine-rich repeat domain-containing protein, partial [Oscillospiraceae bacterium]|nr:leucine-rich repeat domain-containing protein [Oscillospiraceae bacterium]
MKRKFLASLLAVCMALSLLPVTARAASSGTCGTNLNWTLGDDGTLTISGTGAMEDYGYTFDTSAPWGMDSVQTLIIQNGVTSIGDYAFDDCTKLTSVTIPNSVTSIGASAFSNCSSLTSVTIPGSVTSIGERAFFCCNNLTSVTIPGSVTSIGERAFRGCDNLTSVTIPGSMTSIGTYAFAYCSGLTSVTIQEGVASIGDSAFRECINLEYVSIPGSINRIEDGAFERWYSSGDPSIPIECKYYYGGSPDQWLAIESEGAFGDAADSSLMAKYYCCFFPTLTCDDSAIKYGTADPTVTITSDTAFKADVSAADIKLTANTVGLTLASVSLDQTARAGDNKTLTLQFSGTVRAGDLNITVLSSAFSVPVATAEAPGGIDTAMPPIAIGAPPVDPDP